MMDEVHIGRLLPEARDLLDGSLDERIAYINQDRWIPYPKAERVLAKLEAFYDMPDKIRPPSMLLVGDSHCGKTSLVRRFCDLHPPTDGVFEVACPVFYLPACPAEPDEGRLYDEILKELMVPFRYSDKPPKKFEEVKYQFEQIGVKVIIFDEISHAISGSALKQRVFLNAIKNIHTLLKRPIVLVGTHDAQYAASSDRQFESRFKLEELKRWEEDNDYRRFLARLELTLPFTQASLLASPELSKLIYKRAESRCIGDLVDLVTAAAVFATNTDKQKITAKEIEKCDFKPSYLSQPSESVPK
jgi:hypothetical protein